MGFQKAGTTPTPDAIFDYWLTRLAGSELRVLLYAVRRLNGFRKAEDAISLDQFQYGIRTRDGHTLDGGTGCSRSTIIKALLSLDEKKLLIRQRHADPRRGDQTTTYRLFVAPSTTPVPDELFDYWLPRFKDVELRTILYIIRRTLGFRKETDVIGKEQFLHGITSRGGDVLDWGCGLSNRALYEALNGLKEKGLIAAQRRVHRSGASLPTRYRLVFDAEKPAFLRPDPRTAPDVDEEEGVAGEEMDGRAAAETAPPPAPRHAEQGAEGRSMRSPPGFDPVTPGVDSDHPREVDAITPGRPVRSPVGDDSGISDGRSGHREGDAPITAPGPMPSPRGAQSGYRGSVTKAAPQQTAGQRTALQGTEYQQTGEQQQVGGVVLHTSEEIASYPLAADEVLVARTDGGAEVVTLRALVQRDIEETEHHYGIPVVTECYYSAEHFLGIGGEDWTPQEERKYGYHMALRRDLDALYKDIGACSLDDALAEYFTPDLVARFHSTDPVEMQRQRSWLRYIRSEAGRNLQNPGGFLRSRLEGVQWPPRGVRTR